MLLTISEIITNSLSLYRKNWKLLDKYVLLIFLSSFVTMVAGALAIYLDMYWPATYATTNVIVLILIIASFFFNIWVSTSLIIDIGFLLRENRTITLRESLNLGLQKLWPVILVSILLTLILAGGTLLFIIPGIIFLFWFAFSIYAVVLDNKGVIDSLSESKRLVVGRWFAIAWRIFAPNFLFFFSLIVLETALVALIKYTLSSSPLAAMFTENVVITLINALYQPLITLALVLAYFSARESLPEPAKQP